MCWVRTTYKRWRITWLIYAYARARQRVVRSLHVNWWMCFCHAQPAASTPGVVHLCSASIGRSVSPGRGPGGRQHGLLILKYRMIDDGDVGEIESDTFVTSSIPFVAKSTTTTTLWHDNRRRPSSDSRVDADIVTLWGYLRRLKCEAMGRRSIQSINQTILGGLSSGTTARSTGDRQLMSSK